MGQQPNIELEISQLPRPTPKPAPARPWRPNRPGEISSPEEMPWGGVYGTTGPDTGYALKLIKERMIPLAEGENRHNAEEAIAALVGARASFFGRAPTKGDVDVAMIILGYDGEGAPSNLLARLAEERVHRIANLGHDLAKERALVAAVPVEHLSATADDLRRRMEAGEALVTWSLER